MISVAAAKEKFRTKKEIYDFLVFDVQAFLPPIQDVSTFFLKDLISGKKQVGII